MTMQQAAQQAPVRATFVIEATSHCRNGKMPRWTFLIQGVNGNSRSGMIGTDEQGRGLFIYPSPQAQASRKQLVSPGDLSLPDTLSRGQANDEVMKLITRIDWDDPQFSLKAKSPRFELYAVA